MPRIRSGRVIRRPRYAAYTERPPYTECGRVYSGAAQLGRAYGRLYTAAYSRARPVSIEPRVLGWPGRAGPLSYWDYLFLSFPDLFQITARAILEHVNPNRLCSTVNFQRRCQRA